jgi:NAD(P)-dependent dehydrogenase (short-subunit alcohol dehydrogenase family)
MAPVVYLVSGANRGIGEYFSPALSATECLLRRHTGLGLVKTLSERADTIVFAGARDPGAAKELTALAAARPGKVHVVKLVSGDVDDNAAAVKFIKEKAGRLDVVIANAGLCS